MSAGEERRRSEHPRSTRVSRDTTEMRAVVMTNIGGFSSFGLTASKNLESLSKFLGCHKLNNWF